MTGHFLKPSMYPSGAQQLWKAHHLRKTQQKRIENQKQVTTWERVTQNLSKKIYVNNVEQKAVD